MYLYLLSHNMRALIAIRAQLPRDCVHYINVRTEDKTGQICPHCEVMLDTLTTRMAPS